MTEILGTGDDRDGKNDMAEGDIDDMAEVDDDAELGMREGMMEMMGVGDDSNQKNDIAGVENGDELDMRDRMNKEDEAVGNDGVVSLGGEREDD